MLLWLALALSGSADLAADFDFGVGAPGWWMGVLLALVALAPALVAVAAMRTQQSALRAAKEEAERARAQAEEANRAKSEFLANMSHEIRTPLNAISGLAHLSLERNRDPKIRHYLTGIGVSSVALLEIVNNILDFSKIEAGRLELEQIEFDLCDVLSQIATQLGVDIRRKGGELLFQVAPGVPGRLVGDPLRLGQVLRNLVGNAVKFSTDGDVLVCIEVDRRDEVGFKLRFTVQDQGVGIAPERQQQLFEAFRQADSSTTRRFGGTGLGLAISQRLTRIMGGTISMQSREGEGSSFQFTARFGACGHPWRPRTVPRDLRGRRILVADENPVARDLLVGTLRTLGFDAKGVESGSAAIEVLERADLPYDVAMLDWSMPSPDGVESARRIRRDLRLAGLRIVLISNLLHDSLPPDSDERLFNGLLAKPILPCLLRDFLVHLLHGELIGITPPYIGTPPARREQLQLLHGKRILVAEDNAINQVVIREILEHQGFRVDLAANGLEAVEKVCQGSYDAVLMDVQMPVMDGYEAARRIRELPGGGALPIIAATAHALTGDRERCLEAGMDDYVAKPIEPSELFARLSEWVVPGIRLGAVVGGAQIPLDPRLALLAKLREFQVGQGLARLNGNPDLYLRLLRTFHLSYGDLVVRLERILDEGKMDAAHRLIHSFKGAAGNLGAMALHDAAAAMESALMAGGEPPAALLQELRRRLEEAMAAIGLTIAGDEPEPAQAAGGRKAVDQAELGRLLEALGRTLEAGSVDAGRQMAEIVPRIPVHHGELASLLVGQIEDYEFAAASATLARLLREL